ncbi:hypothetical protein CHF27_006945 [Romboutsia maritimum]|uniref:Uncharacterized protein n=1 Tax=Romboutsia maritimum TaxID=2020948 RepID=A0A371IT47_9FIRM|nr:hypothetical protein [Romboutsia maritimum]RDY23666.1 hypothetical protein CHF27_006945 [Romboutsia maritimum]
MKILDLIIILIDTLLVMYFFNFAIDTTDITTRIMACLAMTMEVYFIMRHIKLIKSSSTKERE